MVDLKGRLSQTQERIQRNLKPSCPLEKEEYPPEGNIYTSWLFDFWRSHAIITSGSTHSRFITNNHSGIGRKLELILSWELLDSWSLSFPALKDVHFPLEAKHI